MDGINQGALPVFAPQGILGGLAGGFGGGALGGALGGWLGNRNLGQQIGNVAGGFLGSLLPFGVDPQQYLQAQQIAALSQAQQNAQLAPQGWLGNTLGAIGGPVCPGKCRGRSFGAPIRKDPVLPAVIGKAAKTVRE